MQSYALESPKIIHKQEKMLAISVIVA